MRRKHRSVQPLVNLLRDVQHHDELTTAQLAERLGVSVSTVDMVYGGWRSPGPKFLRGILRAFPQLREQVYIFLLRNISDSEDDVIFQ